MSDTQRAAEQKSSYSTADESVKMWLDDIRDPAMYGCIGWTWVRTADEAIAMLQTGRVTHCSLDHDLDMDATLGYCPSEKTGYDVVCWMEENNVWPEYIAVHSLNPSGKERMKAAIRRSHPRYRSIAS